MGNLDLSQIKLDTSALPAIDMNSILSQLDVQFSREQLKH